MSDTPRTDAFYAEHPIAEYEQTTVDPDDGMAWLEFARQLERELSARPEEGLALDAARYRWILSQAKITDFIFAHLRSRERHVSNAIDNAMNTV